MRRHYEPSMASEFRHVSQASVAPILARPTGAVRVVDSGFIPFLAPSDTAGWTRVASGDIAALRAEFAALPPEEPTPREQAQRARRVKAAQSSVTRATRTRARQGATARTRRTAA